MLTTQSANHLSYFLKYTVRCFKELSPLALVEQRWSQVSLQLALSCSSRHYAGRSFQILRALQIRPSTPMLSDILSRLVETVAEQGEDMQGYVTEMMLTLEASIDNLDLEFRPIDFMRELFMSTPNLAKDASEMKRSAITAPKQVHNQHARSTSYTVSAYTQRSSGGITRKAPCQKNRKPAWLLNSARGDGRIRSCTEVEGRRSNLGRSRSAQSLKNLDQQGAEDKLTLVTQMFWMTTSLLESDYEYEFSLAVRLLDKILCHLQPERPECRDKLDKILHQIKWPNFPGVYILLLKGCTSSMAAESTFALLSKIILCVNSPIIDPTSNWGFPMVTIALLPYLVQNYENPSQICRDTADRVAQMCNHQGERLSNLATVMSLYSRGTFGKDSFQWTKCVIRYLLDEYAPAAISMCSFLVEVLEKGQSSYQPPCLQILYCMVHYLDVQTGPSTVLNVELFQSVSRYLQSCHWREALKICKLAVTRSSTLAAPPPSTLAMTSSSELTMFTHSAHTSFAEAESLSKFSKELPGRTLDFTIDMARVAIIGRKFCSPDKGKIHTEEKEKTPSISGSAVSLSRKPSNNQDLDSVWRRPQASQARTRERLVNLLTCFGQRVGLPKSPSVIFSQSSDTLDHQASVGGSSGEETSLPEASSNDTLLGNESSGNELMVTFKGFDFLDNELEESESEDFFFQLHDRRHSMHIEPSPTPSSRQSFGSEPNLQMMALPKAVGSPRDSVTEQPSSDDESESSEQETSGATTTMSDITGNSNTQPSTPRRNRLPSSPLTGSTHSLSSNTPSESDTVDLHSPQASPLTQLLASLLTLPADEVEEAWRAHVGKVMAESSLSHVGRTCQLFPRLFRELRKRLTTMTKEACYYISKTESLKNVTSQILQVLDLVHQQLECPFLYSESDSVLGSRLLDRHRFCVMEIQECFQTYSQRKDQAEQSLESLKSSIKQQSLGDGGSFIFCGEEQQVELCQRLYKLLFQLVLLFESYLKLLDAFLLVTATPQVVDVSGQVISVRKELTLALQELENGQASPFNVDTKVVSKQEAVAALAEYLNGGQYLRAIQILRCFRSLWPSDIFGMTCEDDVLMLLNIYCSSLGEKKAGVFALTKTSLELTPLYGQLMDISSSLTNPCPPVTVTTAAMTLPPAQPLVSSASGYTAPLTTSVRDGEPPDIDTGGGGDITAERLELLLKSSDSSIL